MGATRESSWSDGIFAAWSCGGAACAERGAIYADVSPGRMAIVQTITSRYRKVALKTFRLGFMATSTLDHPLAPNESIKHACAHRFIICPRRARPLFDARSYCFLAVTGKKYSSRSQQVAVLSRARGRSPYRTPGSRFPLMRLLGANFLRGRL